MASRSTKQPLSNDSQIRCLKQDPDLEKTFPIDGCPGLYLTVYPSQKVKDGGKYFVFKYRYPPAGVAVATKRKQKTYRIGVYGKGVGEFTLRAAKDEWLRIKQWMHQTGKCASELKKEKRTQIRNEINALSLIHI